MSFLNISQQIKKIILYLLAVIAAVSIAGVLLFNFPFYYEMNPVKSTITFLLVSFGLFIFIQFVNKAFILPYLSCIQKRNNQLFVIFLAIFLSILIIFTSNYLWTTPESYVVDFCFDGIDKSSALAIQRLAHPITNRYYPPNNFNFERYPIIIETGECVTGQVITLLGRSLRYSGGAHLAVTIQDDPPEGRFFISINNAPSVVLLEKDNDQLITQTILVREGFRTSSPWSSSWGRYWFYGSRGTMLIVSATYLSLFLFGLTERTIMFSAENENNLDG